MTQLGRYEILHELKTGGMGEVLLARRRGPGAFEQLVAIKTIRAQLARVPEVRAMFLDEAAILARLHDPAVAHVHDFGEEGDTLYMVMEYVAGVPFRDLFELGAPPHVAAQALAAAARGLDAAHEARDLAGAPLGLVHRDVSPDNLLLGYDGHVKVIDFGIALVKNRQTPVTEMGTIKGKPPYMSPEQVKNEPLDRRSDVFSLGAVAWEMLTGKQLFTGESIFAIAMAVGSDQAIATPSEGLGAPLPPGFDAAVLGALDRDPDRRTATARDLAEAFERVADATGGESLAAWTTRTLAGARETHSRWLATLLGGGTVGAPPRGRATGMITALAPTPVAEPAPVAAPPAPVTSTEVELAPPARGRRTALVVALLALLVLGVAIVIATRPHHASSSPRDAAVVLPPPADVAIVVPVDVADAIDAAAPADAAVVAVDAGHVHVAARVDAGVVTVAPHVDAAVAVPVPVTGTGFVTIRYKPGPYVNISIDSGSPLPGPIFKRKVPAGRHTIAFLDPVTGDVLDTQTISVGDGETVAVAQH